MVGLYKPKNDIKVTYSATEFTVVSPSVSRLGRGARSSGNLTSHNVANAILGAPSYHYYIMMMMMMMIIIIE